MHRHCEASVHIGEWSRELDLASSTCAQALASVEAPGMHSSHTFSGSAEGSFSAVAVRSSDSRLPCSENSCASASTATGCWRSRPCRRSEIVF